MIVLSTFPYRLYRIVCIESCKPIKHSQNCSQNKPGLLSNQCSFLLKETIPCLQLDLNPYSLQDQHANHLTTPNLCCAFTTIMFRISFYCVIFTILLNSLNISIQKNNILGNDLFAVLFSSNEKLVPVIGLSLQKILINTRNAEKRNMLVFSGSQKYMQLLSLNLFKYADFIKESFILCRKQINLFAIQLESL